MNEKKIKGRSKIKSVLKWSGVTLGLAVAVVAITLSTLNYTGNEKDAHEDGELKNPIDHELTDEEIKDLIGDSATGNNDIYYEDDSDIYQDVPSTTDKSDNKEDPRRSR